jgi:rhodanese-related sulfurtransferase
MVTKGFKALLAEANAEIESIGAHEALALHGDPDVVFVDVRESGERRKGAIPDSVAAPRGFLEFIADPEGPSHRPELVSGKKLILVCASGGRSALAGVTLRGMGIVNVVNLAGGIAAWQQVGGPVETG